jgi:uncharacterized RDD family membrane protein YckC
VVNAESAAPAVAAASVPPVDVGLPAIAVWHAHVAPGSPPPRYVGLVTRLIGFAVDAAVINLVALVVELGIALILSLLHPSHDVKTVIAAIGGAAYILWSVGYFVGFWSITGRTPGCQAMRIRVVSSTGDRLTLGRAIVRLLGVILAALPLGAGFLPILFDRRRRGLQDRLAGSLVVEAPAEPMAQRRRRQPLSAADAEPGRGEGSGGSPLTPLG